MNLEDRVLNVGDQVVFFDEQQQAFQATVTEWLSAENGDTVKSFRERVADGHPVLPHAAIEYRASPDDAELTKRSSVIYGLRSDRRCCFLWADEL